MEEQARLSHLAFDSDYKPPQRSTDGWPRLLGGWRQAHASIVVGEGNKESIVVLGGWTGEKEITDSVLVMNTTGKQFREGPSMSERRYFFAVGKVNIGVYACGGLYKSSKACGGSRKSKKYSDTIERIDVNELLETPATSKTGKWKTLQCRLTTPRGGCTACDVYSRYLVIVGGHNGRNCLSSVDILDTGGDGNNHTIVAGIDLNCARRFATSEVIGTRMFVVGGRERNNQWLRSVEYVEFGCYTSSCSHSPDGSFETSGIICHDNSNNTISVFQTNSCWTLDNDLALSQGIGYPAMTKIGKCMIVADGSLSLASVEVLDTDRRVVWSLPSMTLARQGGSMVALSQSLVVIGGFCNDSLESLPILFSKQEQLQSGKIPAEDKKATPQQGATMANLASLPQPDLFYAKLVQDNDDPMIGKVHELSALVFHAHHVKVFHTLLNHLFRSGLISLEHRRHYITKALKVINTTITNAPEQEQEIFATILDKAVEDGALSEIDLEEMKQHHETTGSPKQIPHETDVRQHLASMQFRVGKVHGRPNIDATKPPPSSSVHDKNHQKNCILEEVQVLGWSLNQLQTAYFKERHEEVAIAAICSILNACRFGASVQDGTREQNHTVTSVAPPPLILPRILDFGDVHHIGHVVEQSVVLSAQRAFAEGIALVDKAIAAAEQNETKLIVVRSLVQHSRTGSLSSLDILVSVMGKFANAVSQWYKKHGRNCGSNEEVTILALAVTAKLVQASESRMTIKTDDSSNIESLNIESSDTEFNALGLSVDEVMDDKEQMLCHRRATPAIPCVSASQVPVLAVPTQQGSILARLERLEQMLGNYVPVVQRVWALEHNFRLNAAAGTEMDLADRLTQLEKLL